MKPQGSPGRRGVHKGSSKVNISAAIRLFSMKLIMKPCMKLIMKPRVKSRGPTVCIYVGTSSLDLSWGWGWGDFIMQQLHLMPVLQGMGVSDQWVCKISTTEAKVE